MSSFDTGNLSENDSRSRSPIKVATNIDLHDVPRQTIVENVQNIKQTAKSSVSVDQRRKISESSHNQAREREENVQTFRLTKKFPRNIMDFQQQQQKNERDLQVERESQRGREREIINRNFSNFQTPEPLLKKNKYLKVNNSNSKRKYTMGSMEKSGSLVDSKRDRHSLKTLVGTSIESNSIDRELSVDSNQ